MSSGAARRRQLDRRSPAPRGRVLVNIDRLVLEGLPLRGGQGLQLHEALETEMARLIASGGLEGLRDSSVPKASTSPMPLPRSPSGTQVGNRVAGALHGFLGGRT